MEEILSSIKRIIAEDSEAPTPAPRPAAPAQPEHVLPEPAEEPDVLELTQTVVEHEAVYAFGSGAEDEESISAEEAPAIAPAPVAPSRASVSAEAPAALISATTQEATREALAALSRMVVKPEDVAADNTLEGLVREMLRPMLKDWLDANLPGIVQATVDREVARISGRGA